MKNLALVLLSLSVATSAQTEMTYEQWQMELANAQKREQVGREAIAQEQSKMEAIKEEIALTGQKIDATRGELYALLSATEEDAVAWNARVDVLVSRLQGLLSLSPDELLKRAKELKEMEKELALLKESKVSWLFASAARISEVENLMAQVRANLPDKPNTYIVRLIPGRRDCLWRIAGYDEVFKDPLLWPRLYEANKRQIDNAYDKYKGQVADAKYGRSKDLIFPGQVFDIPR